MDSILVSELMSKNVHHVKPDDQLSHVHSLLRMTGTRHAPVLDGTKLVGVVSQRDIQLAWTRGMNTPVRDFMSKHTQWVFVDAPALDAAHRMLEYKIGCVPVLDRGHALVGIITETDFLQIAERALAGQSLHGRSPSEGAPKD
jgi:CBS domain-containing protein